MQEKRGSSTRDSVAIVNRVTNYFKKKGKSADKKAFVGSMNQLLTLHKKHEEMAEKMTNEENGQKQETKNNVYVAYNGAGMFICERDGKEITLGMRVGGRSGAPGASSSNATNSRASETSKAEGNANQESQHFLKYAKPSKKQKLTKDGKKVKQPVYIKAILFRLLQYTS